jgi:hypothetical protein
MNYPTASSGNKKRDNDRVYFEASFGVWIRRAINSILVLNIKKREKLFLPFFKQLTATYFFFFAAGFFAAGFFAAGFFAAAFAAGFFAAGFFAAGFFVAIKFPP